MEAKKQNKENRKRRDRKREKASPLKKWGDFDQKVSQFEERIHRNKTTKTKPSMKNESEAQQMQKSKYQNETSEFSNIFEGGLNNEDDNGLVAALGEQFNDDPNQEEYDELDDQLGLIVGSAGARGPHAAENIIMSQIVDSQRDVDLSRLDLQNLDFMQHHAWQNLSKINVSRNMLISIDILEMYHNLKMIDASTNYIQSVELNLPKLKELKLANNHLTQFPDIVACKRLTFLDLSNNKIESIEDLRGNKFPYSELQVLNMSNNLLDFHNQDHFADFLYQVKLWRQLRELNILDNPIMNRDYKTEDYIIEVQITRLLRIELFNCQDLGEVEKVIEEKMAGRGENLDDRPDTMHQKRQMTKRQKEELDKLTLKRRETHAQKHGEKKFTNKNKDAPPPTLQLLLEFLELANSQPEAALPCLSNLAKSCDEIIEKAHMLESHFAPDTTDDECIDMIETFMQNSMLLIDNYKDMQNIIMTILAKMSVIRFQNFGLFCFKTLTDLMKSGRDMEEAVTIIIEKEIIEYLQNERNEPTAISVTLLKGLFGLIEETDSCHLLSSLFEYCFPSWLKMYCAILDKCLQNKQKMSDDVNYDSILSLLSISVKDYRPNVLLFKEFEMQPYISMIIQQSSLENQRYIPVLDLVASLANEDGELADYFIENNVHNSLLSQIKKSMKTYFKNNSLEDESNKTDSKEQVMLKYKTLSAEIVTIGGLLQAEQQENREKILSQGVVLDIVTIMGHDFTDPILLTAVCKFAKDLFETEDLRCNEEAMKPFSDKIQSLNQMIPYLGGEKYFDLLEMCKVYNIDAKNKAEDEDDDQEEFNFLEQNSEESGSVADSEALRERQEEKIKQSLKHLDDDIASELFISIIDLMTYFCLEAENYKINLNKIFDGISYDLNEIGREYALFQCLAMPNDDVKLAVVNCLFVVPLDELEIDEISKIVNIVSECQNIGAGKTELVLSTVYWICFKMVNDDSKDDQSAAVIFQRKFGEQMMNEALNILSKNLTRVSPSPEDDQQKYILSLSILNFIKVSYHAPIMQAHMLSSGSKGLFKQILINEDTKSSKTVQEVPLDIENSYFGKSMNALLDTIQGTETIMPYCDVALRVLIRIADILMFRHNCEFVNIVPGDDPKDKLFVKQKISYDKKKKQEQNFWVDMPAGFLEKDGDYMKQESIQELLNQHYAFKNQEGIKMLKVLLTTKYAINEEYIKKLCDPCFIKSDDNAGSLAEKLIEYKNALEEDFEKKYMKGEYSVRKTLLERYNKINQSQPADDEPEPKEEGDQDQPAKDEPKPEEEDELDPDKFTQESRNYRFVQSQQEELVRDDYLHKKDIQVGQNKADIEIQLQSELKADQDKMLNDPNSNGELSLKEQRGDGFLNQQIRSITVAAFLRCLWASIEFAPNYDLQIEAIRDITDPETFRSITQLCDCTDWDEKCHIGAKYLRVMRYVIKLGIDEGFESTSKLMHYEMVSIVIQKCLAKIIDKMNKDIELTNGDTITNYELSKTLFTVVQQTNNFVFSDYNLYKTYLRAEADIEYIKIKSKDKNTDIKPTKMTQLLKESMTGPWKKKCAPQEYDKKKEYTKENFPVDVSMIRKERTIQSKIVEFMILKLFSIRTINSLLDLMFKDMKGDYQTLQGPMGYSDDEDEEEEEKQQDNEDDDYDDETRYDLDMDDYAGLKGTLTIERIKDIIGEIMTSCEGQMQYEILQTIMVGVVFEKKQLRESFMQEILNAQISSSYRTSLETYMNQNEMTCKHFFKRLGINASKVKHERIIELVSVDMNLIELPERYKKGEFNKQDPPQRDSNWYDRLFVVSNAGLQLLKNIPEELRCQNCPKNAFCPRGPIQDFCIRYENIETIVNFPQVPQKLVILYNIAQFDDMGNIVEPLVRFQLTLNFFTFTQCSKVYQSLMGIMNKYKCIKERNEMEGKDDDYNTQFYNTPFRTTYLDRVYAFELRQLIGQIEELKEVPKEKIHKLQAVICELKDTNFLGKAFRDRYINQNFDPEKVKASLQRHKGGGKPYESKGSVLDGESEDLNIPNYCITCCIGGHVLFFKEKWENWEFIPFINFEHEVQELRSYKKDQRDMMQKEEGPWSPLIDGKPREKVSGEDKQKNMEIRCKNTATNLLQLALIVNIDDFEGFEIHKGSNASAELILYEDPVYKVEVDFTGDMERQKFSEAIINFADGNEDEDAKGGGGNQEDEEEDDDSDEDGQDDNMSDRDPMTAQIYD